MPYIIKAQRMLVDESITRLLTIMKDMGEDARKGILNYVITKIVLGVIGDELKYGKINDVVGAMECCKMELYRRLAIPYEDQKSIANGDVYPRY